MSLGGAGNSADLAARARVLRRVAENATPMVQQEFNKAFVLMEYFWLFAAQSQRRA